MRVWQRLRNRISGRADRDLEREIRAHLELEAEDQQDAGLAPEAARYAAHRALGNTALVKEEVRDMWGWTRLEQLLQDLRIALRGARKNPGFAAVAILSMALGIGAATSVFSVLNAVVLRPLPVAQPEQLVVLQPELRGQRFPLFNPLFEELRETQQVLSGMFVVSDQPYMKAAFGNQQPAFVRGSLVSGDYFEVLGVQPAIGRLLSRDDDTPSAEACAAVLSHGFFTGSMNGDPAVIGTPVVVREKVCTIVGVAPASFRGHDAGYSPDLWVPIVPLSDPNLLASRTMGFFSGVMGRLRPGVTPGQAEAQLNTLYQGMQTPNELSPRPGEPPTQPEDYRLKVAPGAQGIGSVRSQFGQPLAIALAITGVVLLIAIVNVANLLLARGMARTAELGTRLALGAGRARLVRLLAMEGVVISIAGGVLGFAMALLAAPLLSKAISHPWRPIEVDASPDLRVLLVAAASVLLAAMLAGVLPAFRLSGQRLQHTMGASGRTTGAPGKQRTTRILVGAQLALSLLLITTAGLLMRTMLQVMGVDPGFNTSQVVLMNVEDTEPAARFGETDGPEAKARRAALYRSLDERLNALPGVRAASLSWLGLFGGNYVGLNVYDVDEPDSKNFTLVDYVSPRYFETVGMQALRGRVFTDADQEGSLRVAVVNEAYVRERISDGKEAIGRRLVMTYADDLRPYTIAGVVRDAKYNDLREEKAEPMLWVPLAQAPYKIRSVALRVQSGTEASVTQEARAALATVSPHLMVRKVTTLRAQVDQATMRERLLFRLAAGFGVLAIVLAAVGLYGMLAFSVTKRTREIGLRLALGAQRGSVLGMVLRESLVVAAGAMVAGIPLSLLMGNLLRSFLYGVTPSDPVTLIGSGVVLTVVALVAALAPARRASRVDPMTALKYE